MSSLTYKGLTSAIESAKKTLEELEELLSRNREYISTLLLFRDGWSGSQSLVELANRVTKIRRVSGWTDSRKNPCPYRGYEYEIEGKTYLVSYGSNWCSSLFDVEASDGTEFRELSKEVAEDTVVANDPNDEDGSKIRDNPVEYLIEEGITEPWLQVAYLLGSEFTV